MQIAPNARRFPPNRPRVSCLARRVRACLLPVAKVSQAAPRRIVVVVVPPVDELDLVGPLQVFSSVNRLAGRPIYSVELVTTAESLQVDGEGGLLAFHARSHFSEVKGKVDSVLLACGLHTRTTRDPSLSAWLRMHA